ncbi:hypothetical protein NP233_g6484 [Leucocoprinus birnbaumii]|uniref:Acyl-CoA desaturase n=1 Tax=Leucocoprinus birnbaumii TaxID=56174 RepID=A0AAD5YVR1_9AGAR|nr:hypothetical protein NP233_g6484 [Leucocoprinus birnbaumii]
MAIPDTVSTDNLECSLLSNPTDNTRTHQTAMKAEEDHFHFTWYSWCQKFHMSRCISLLALHILAFFGPMLVPWHKKTVAFTWAYGNAQAYGITAGYHRLWSHRSYNASRPLQYLLAIVGASAVQRDIEWWCYQHRAHHRFTDTELDPYNALRGFWHSHIGWLLLRAPRRRRELVDIEDLRKNPVVQWQRRNYFLLALTFGVIIPGIIPYWCWNESVGSCVVFAIACRMCVVYHTTWAVNSFSHWLGKASYDDKHTPRDNFVVALLTHGEGYHNFHHEFPMDYRNAVEWYQYDPTKWFIWICQKLGLASHLKVALDNEIKKSRLSMYLKTLRLIQDKITWPPTPKDLPVVDWNNFRAQSLERPLIVIAGFIHDVSEFIDQHPGGSNVLLQNVGRDVTTAFFGGVYDHSNAAHNLLSMMRVGVLRQGVEPHKEMVVTPCRQRLMIKECNETSVQGDTK